MKPTPEEITARFMIKLHLAGKGYPSARESGTPFFPPEATLPENLRARVTDNRASYYLRALDQKPEALPASRLPLILDCLLVWASIIAVIWWFCHG